MCIEMGLRWVRVSLRGYSGETPTGAEFFNLLAMEPERRFSPSESPWGSSNIELFSVDIADLQGYDEPSEEFAERIEQGFLRATDWLASRPAGVFDRWRESGRKADIFIGGWLSNEQFDLVLPASFLMICGKAGLPIQICTND